MKCQHLHIEEVECTSDYNDPNAPNGHGQREWKEVVCQDCGETLEPAHKDEDYDTLEESEE